MSSKQIVLYPTTQEERDALPMVSDVQFMDKFASTAINQKFAGVFQSGVYRGFDVVDSGNGVVTVAGSADGDTAIVNLAGNICMTVNAQSAINVQLEANVSYTLVLNAFYEHGTTTTQVDSTSQIPPASLSLIPYGTESSEQVVLADVQWSGVGAVVIDVNRRQNGSPLNVYSKDHVDTALSVMSEAESLAIRKAKHAKYAANDFIYHGKNSASVGARVNEGLTAYGGVSVDHINQFYLGPAHSSQYGDSPTVMPVFNMGGAEIPFSAFVDRFPFKLPPAEKGYRTYNSNGGESINYLTDAAPQYVGKAGYETLAERAILSGLTEEQEAICSAHEGIARNGDFRFGNDGQWYEWGQGSGSNYFSIADGKLSVTTINTNDHAAIDLTSALDGVSSVIEVYVESKESKARLSVLSTDFGWKWFELEVGHNRIELKEGVRNAIRLYCDNGYSAVFSKVSARPSTQEIVKNRVDLSTLEIYQEESTDGELFPFCIQSKASNVISGVPMILSKRPKSYFAQYEGQYPNPEETNDEFYCWDWPSLTFAQKKLVAQYLGETLFMGKNGYLVQDRVRARTFAGNGDGDWVSINPAVSSGVYYNILQFGNAAYENVVYVQGDNDAPKKESANYRYRPAPNHRNKLGGNGVYNSEYGVGGYNSTGVTFQAACFMYVVATTPRLNAAGWHPSYNPMGACTLDLDSSVFGSQVEISSFLDCCLNATNGDIASGVSGRPDGKYFDAIYPSGEGGIVDHRLKYGAWDASSAEQAATVRSEVIGGVYRGREQLVKTSLETNEWWNSSFDGYKTNKYEVKNGYAYIYIGTPATQFKVGDTVFLYDKTKDAIQFSFVVQSVGSAGYVRSTNYKVYDYVNYGLNSTEVYLIVAGQLNITVEGNFHQLNVVATPDELLSNPLLKDGFVGSWVPVIPDGTAQDVPMTRKSLDSQLGYSLSVDGGASWTSGDTTTFNDVENSVSLSLAATDVGIYDYTAFAKQTGQNANLAVLNRENGVGSVCMANSSHVDYGCLLGESLMGNVNVGTFGWGRINSLSLIRVFLDKNGLVINTSRDTNAEHGEIKLDGANPAYKALTLQAGENGQATLSFVANEIVYDDVAGDWGGNTRVYTSASSSFTDDNGNVCKSDIHKLAKSYGWIKDRV